MAVKQIKSFTELREQAKRWHEAKGKAREATNAFNKENTKLKDTYKAYLVEAELPPATSVELPQGRFSYIATETETIDPKGWYALWQSGDITEEQYFACIKIGKAPAEIAAGADMLAGITSKSPGKKRDIRFEELDDDPDRENVILPEPPKKKGIAPRTQTVQPSASKAPAAPNGLRKIRMPRNG